jgi:hypothetical protein
MSQEIPLFYPETSPEAPKTGVLPSFSLEKTENTQKVGLEGLSQTELLDLHTKVESRLTGIRLSELNLEKETLLQYQKAKKLQEDANNDKEVPMNQRAQVQNSLGNLLERLSKMQLELYNSEALKRLKAVVIKVVKAQPKEFQDQFFEMLDGEVDAAEREMME